MESKDNKSIRTSILFYIVFLISYCIYVFPLKQGNVIPIKIHERAVLIRKTILKEEKRKLDLQRQKDIEIQKIREASESEVREANEKMLREKKNKFRKISNAKKPKVRYVGGVNPSTFKQVDNVNNSKISISIVIEWDDITFQDGFLLVRARGGMFEIFAVKEASKSLNAIKSHYKFRNAPKLSLLICGYRILRILNDEILFYYIQFLTNASSILFNNIVKSIPVFGKWKTYTKSYYIKHLPELFKTDCFSFLCEFADNNLPIIPVPEIVINRSGFTQIDDSFLFPFVNSNSIYWLWESIEQSKASYLFQTPVLDFESHLQSIYDYLTGTTLNKRETLIVSPKLQQQLCLKTRIMHTDFANWKSEVKIYSS